MQQVTLKELKKAAKRILNASPRKLQRLLKEAGYRAHTGIDPVTPDIKPPEKR